MVFSLRHDDPSLALATDLYELTMAKAYWANGMTDREAEFHMFYRRNPFNGGFVVFAGLATLIDILQEFRFSAQDLSYLATLKDRVGNPLFEEEFLRYLAALEFNCDLLAMPEGTVVFPNEPLLRVRGPIVQAQLLETIVLNVLNFQSLVATKAARICQVAAGDPVIDFGLRRAQGLDGGLSASRACYVGGCVGTSNVLAGKLLGIPVMGTHAHSWVMAFDSELEAFRAFARTMPDNCVFLVDTYGSLQGVRNAIEVARELQAGGHKPIGVRLDSGDLAYFAKAARRMLDEAGLQEMVVMASNELDEYVMRSLKLQGAPIGAWGVGTKLVTAQDDPALSGVYKLTAIRDGNGWEYKLKLSDQKAKISIPGVLQVYRCIDRQGTFEADAILDIGERPEEVAMIVDPNDNTNVKRVDNMASKEPLLVEVFRGGTLVYDPPGLAAIRARVGAQLALVDGSHKRLENPHIYPVGLSPHLNALRDRMIRQARGVQPMPE
ncbi:MAG: nicotinate phosphoribosyltransferase [Candidatus Lambdaproteobacteria bacterium]|nr:nicotinate phosphoribosyltransferase [Candidatus Lambdaproteobacteria bacterium]